MNTSTRKKTTTTKKGMEKQKKKEKKKDPGSRTARIAEAPPLPSGPKNSRDLASGAKACRRIPQAPSSQRGWPEI